MSRLAAYPRNDSWRDDFALKEDLTKYVRQGMQRKEMLDFFKRDFPRYAWSIPTLDRRLRLFNIFYTDTNVTVDEVKEAVGKELAGPGPASWLPSIAQQNSTRTPFKCPKRPGICSHAGNGS